MCKFPLRHSDVRTDKQIYKTREVVKTYLNVTSEDLFSNAPILANISCFISLCQFVRRYVEGKICRKFAFFCVDLVCFDSFYPRQEYTCTTFLSLSER